MILYKYSVWKDYVRDGLKQSTLYYNTPEKFNDPFDSYPRFVLDQNNKESFFKMCIKEGCEENVLRKMSDDEILRIQRGTDKSHIYNTKYGVTCFTKNNDNVLMWSHYADSHRGICLGFSFDEMDKSLEKFFNIKENEKVLGSKFYHRLIPIVYTNDLRRPTFSFESGKDFIDEVLSRKSGVWKYEEEFRIRVQTRRERVFPNKLYYMKSCLKEVIIGAEMSLGDYIDCQKTIDDLSKDITVYVARLDDNMYKLNIEILDNKSKINILNNFKELQCPEWLYDYTMIRRFGKKIGKSNLKKIWKKALRNLTMNEILTNMKIFEEISMNKFIKKGISSKVSLYDDNSTGCIYFLNYMLDQMEYEKYKDDN